MKLAERLTKIKQVVTLAAENNPEFRANLLKDPYSTIEKAFSTQVPEQIIITAVEMPDKKLNLEIKPREDIPQEELDKVFGGFTGALTQTHMPLNMTQELENDEVPYGQQENVGELKQEAAFLKEEVRELALERQQAQQPHVQPQHPKPAATPAKSGGFIENIPIVGDLAKTLENVPVLGTVAKGIASVANTVVEGFKSLFSGW